MYRHRALLLATVCLGSATGGFSAAAQTPQAKPPRHHHRAPPVAPAAITPLPVAETGGLIQAIQITGNERIEQGTILSYMLVQPGDPFAGDRVDRSLRTLYATGLFADVSLHREGATLVVHVKENPLVNTISFEGNHNVKEEDLHKALELRPRAVFTVRMAQSDREKILGVYAGKGRFAATVEPEIVRLGQNRVNVIYRIVEGPQTKISRIIFTGNHAFSEKKLREIIQSREQRWYKFLSSSDQFDPQRTNFDRELLRRFYLAHGYADFLVHNVTAELSPNREAIFLTYQLDEGDRYRVGKITVTSDEPKVSADAYKPLVLVESGAYYNGTLVENSSDAMQTAIRETGFPFITVNPRISRDKAHHTVDLAFNIAEGPRQYIERIDITGNSRTKDKVIRREMKFAEGDPYDTSLVRLTKTRLTDLGYFTDVKITPSPGSSDDHVVVNAVISEKATGELSLGGGYSTQAGILGQAGLREHNLIGSGIDAGINGTIGAYQSQLDISATDPYFLDRNLVAGFDLFYLNNSNYQGLSDYSEARFGGTWRLGYAYNDHVSQAFSYTLSDRDVHNVLSTASVYVQDEAGWSLLSQVGTTLSFDWRDSRVEPHRGFVAHLGGDLAGLGGDEHYVRGKVDATYFVPLDRITGNSDWGVAVSAGAGYIDNFSGQERIIDRFFLGGDNLRGFLDQGVGPHSVAYIQCGGTGPSYVYTPGVSPINTKPGVHQSTCFTDATGLYRGADSLGGNFIWTQSTELKIPLPVNPDFGLSSRAFVDMGGLSGLSVPANALFSCLDTSAVGGSPTTPAYNSKGQPINRVDDHGKPIHACYYNDSSPRISAGFGVSWKSPFGLINIDIGIPLLKKSYDQTEIFRFGFGTRFQ